MRQQAAGWALGASCGISRRPLLPPKSHWLTVNFVSPCRSPRLGLSAPQPFQFLLLNVLREYLAHDLIVPNLPFAWDLERALDDFVFLWCV